VSLCSIIRRESKVANRPLESSAAAHYEWHTRREEVNADLEILGGVIPELDSHSQTPENLDPLINPFSHWHACGPSSLYPTYSSVMRQNSHLRLLKVICRLESENSDCESAEMQWERLFGVPRNVTAGKGLQFLNAVMEFVPGEPETSDGIESITIGIVGRDRFRGVLERAEKMGVWCEGGWAEMVGVRWFFEFIDERVSRL
jgi:hypothetical protein